MKFKVDENLPAELRDDLRVAGHEAETIPEEGSPVRLMESSLSIRVEKATRY